MSSPTVLLSCFSDDQRRKMTALVEKLGGRVIQSLHYDQRCTHVVVGAISSTEKLLAGAIAGKWVVKPDYVECSYKARKWLEAEKFVLETVGSGNEKKLSEVPSRWRRFRLQNGNRGPFRSWKVLLALPDSDKVRYRRLLQAGGACVVTDKPPYIWAESISDRLTHIFTNRDLFKTVLSIHRKGVPCIHPDYVKDYIIQRDHPDTRKYRANTYVHPAKKPTSSGCRKITSYMLQKCSNPNMPTKSLSVRNPNRVQLTNNCNNKVVVLDCHQRSCDPHQQSCDPNSSIVIDLTPDDLSPHPPSEGVTSTPSSEQNTTSQTPHVDHLSIASHSPSDCVTSQAYPDCVTSQASLECVTSHSPSDCVTSQAPPDCVTSQAPLDCVTSHSPSDCVTSHSPPDCVTSHSPSHYTTSQATGCIDSASCNDVLYCVPSSSSEVGPIIRHSRKRKRKHISSVQQEPLQLKRECVDVTSGSYVVGDSRVAMGTIKLMRSDQLFRSMLIILHHRGLYTAQEVQSAKLMKASLETVLQAYLTDPKSVVRGLNYCHSLLVAHVPSANLLHHLTDMLVSDQSDDGIVAMVFTVLNKLLLLHQPHGVVARQQYFRLFDILGGDSNSVFRKWEGLLHGIMNNRPQLLQYLTNIILLDYKRWLLLPCHNADKPLLHKIMWANRSCDLIRPVRELSKCFVDMLDSYHDNKYYQLESLCYLMYLISHYLQTLSATPALSAAPPPPHLQAAQLASSSHAREMLISVVNSYLTIDDYRNYLQQLLC